MMINDKNGKKEVQFSYEHYEMINKWYSQSVNKIFTYPIIKNTLSRPLRNSKVIQTYNAVDNRRFDSKSTGADSNAAKLIFFLF